MQALRKLTLGAGPLAVEDVPVPVPGPGYVRIAVVAAGMCGTDLHIMDGSYASAPPVTLGHEIAGVVDDVGPGVDRSWLGVRVCPEPPISCGACHWCRTGLPMHCPDRKSVGTRLDGGFAAYVVVPARNLHTLPDAVPDHAGALVEPLACVCNGLTDPGVISPGDRVIVIGPGTIGILAAQVAVAAGARTTLVGLRRDAARLAIASGMGLDARESEDPRTRAALDVEASDRAVDAVVECSGTAPAVAWALSLLRPRGRLVQLGLMADESSVPLSAAILREATITGSYGSTPASWARAIALLDTGAVRLEPLVTSVLPLADWRLAVARFQDQDGIKTVFDPRLP